MRVLKGLCRSKIVCVQKVSWRTVAREMCGDRRDEAVVSLQEMSLAVAGRRSNLEMLAGVESLS